MSVFRSIVFTAALSGLLVGGVVTGLQHLGTVPLIQKGEVYEEQAKASVPAAAAHVHADGTAHIHADGATHAHEAAWEPKDGLERNAYTALANVLTAMGFALVLAGLIIVSGRKPSWREGLFWGLGGFAAFTIAPGLGLPPELPGMPAAALEQRQFWWVATAAATAAGLALLVFNRSFWAAGLAIVLIAAPHVIGAPQLADVHTNVPEALSRKFITAVTITSLVFWVLLGVCTATFQRRFGASA